MYLSQIYSITMACNFVVLCCLLKDDIFSLFSVFVGWNVVLLDVRVRNLCLELIIFNEQSCDLFAYFWKILELLYLFATFAPRRKALLAVVLINFFSFYGWRNSP